MQGYTYNLIAIIIVFLLLNPNIGEENVFEGFKIPCTDTSQQCLKRSIQTVLPVFVRGIPSLGIDILDPFKVDKINLEMPGGLIIEFREGYSKGLRKCIVESASLIGDKYNVILHCNFTIKGKYRSRGKMFMFPIDGEGNATIICKNIKIDCSAKLDTNNENGEKFFELQEYNIKHSYEGQVFYKITNLFKGNPELSDTLLEFMNRNWRLIAEEFGDPIVKYGIQSFLINVKKMIKTVPMNKLIRRV